MSFIGHNNKRGGGKGGPRRNENNRIYANPLPLLLTTPEVSSYSPARILGLFGASRTKLENPHCEAVFEPTTRSVWVINRKDAMVLWHRGFFGKGDLSRSEPSWHTRQVNARQAAGKCMWRIESR